MNTGLFLHTLLGLLLLLIPAGALFVLERKMLRRFGWAMLRMVVQLLVLCLVVWALVEVDSPWLSVAWLVVMAIVSGALVLVRCKQDVRRLLLPVSAGLLLGVGAVGLWLLAVVLPASVFDARWFVPMMALLLGHSSAMLLRGLSTFLSALKADEEQYEFLRGNGLPHQKVLLPFLRRALLAVVAPTMANLSQLGIASMPLLLCGLFLGGLSPAGAFVTMLMMTVGCVSASVLALLLSLLFADKVLFDKLGKLL